MAQKLGMSTDLQSKINLTEAISKCKDSFEPQIIEHIRRDGLGVDLVLESEGN